MSGPLEREFAQVRDELNRCAFGTESTTGLHDALAALSSIERHVQDMETALDAAREVNERAKEDLPEWYADDGEDSLPEYEYFIRLDSALAALPAREKGTE